MLYFEEYLEIDPDKKTAEWATSLITHLRSQWQPLVDPTLAAENMALILSRYDMVNVKKMFKNPEKLGISFVPISVMEKLRNILIGERVKADVNVNLKAVDPTAESDRERDKKLLKNRDEMQALFSHLQQSIGLPEYDLSAEKKLPGKNPFKGNVELFDELGLDPTSGADISYFFKVWHRLLYEMRAQDVVNFFFEFNQVRENVDNWVNDILGKKAIAAQSFVSEVTGAIELKYLAPERLRVIPGKRDDGKDAVCIGYEETVTVSDVIKRIGNDFNWDIDLPYLLNAVSYANNIEVTGLWDGQSIIYGGGTQDQLVHVDRFLNFKVSIGYIEFKTFNASAYKVGKDYHGNFRAYKKSLAPTVIPEEENGYAKETYYTEHTYKSFYLATSSLSQKLYKYGPLFHQTVDGMEDEYSNFSIFFKKEAGPTVAEVARPWIDIIQESFAKGRWMIRRAKPKGRAYNYESLVNVATKMFPEGNNNKVKVTEVINMFEEGINEIFTIPVIAGQGIGGGINPNYDLPNGLDEGVLRFKDIINWAIENIKGDLGINDIREAYSPKPNDGYKLQMQALESSRNSTDYMERMIDAILQQMAVSTLSTTQDIIKYKTSIAYKFLTRAVGYQTVDDLAELEGIPLHRYGIFVNSFANYNSRQKILADTEQAWINGEIEYHVKLLIDSVEDYRHAAYILSFEKLKAKTEKQQELSIANDRAVALENLRQKNIMAKVDLEGQWAYRKEDRKGYWYYMSYELAANNKVSIQDMKIEGEANKISQKTKAEIEKEQVKESIKNQQPVV